MRTTVNAERIADCPFSFAVAEADVIFALLQNPSDGGVRVPYRELRLPFRGQSRITARLHTGVAGTSLNQDASTMKSGSIGTRNHAGCPTSTECCAFASSR